MKIKTNLTDDRKNIRKWNGSNGGSGQWRDTNLRGHVHLANFETRGSSQRSAQHTEWEEQQDIVKELSSRARNARCWSCSVSPMSSWKSGESVCTTSVDPLQPLERIQRTSEGRKREEEEEEEEYRIVEGVLARENIECTIMKNSVKISSVQEVWPANGKIWRDIPPQSDCRKMFRGTISRETWTLALLLFLFAHVACLDVKPLRNNSFTTSNYGVSTIGHK